MKKNQATLSYELYGSKVQYFARVSESQFSKLQKSKSLSKYRFRRDLPVNAVDTAAATDLTILGSLPLTYFHAFHFVRPPCVRLHTSNVSGGEGSLVCLPASANNNSQKKWREDLK
jgi:hypothetical protein